MKDNEISKLIKAGWIRAIVIFEVVGKPKAHVETALSQYVDNIKGDERIKVIEEALEEAIEHEDGMWSCFAECDLLFKDLETITWMSINFSPASIEVLEPEDLSVESRQMTAWLNDLLAQIHEISTNFRSQKAANEHLTVAMNQLIQNTILLSLRDGAKNPEDLERDTGIILEQLAPFLQHLVKKGKILDLKHSYALPDPAHISGILPVASYETVGELPEREAKRKRK